MSQANGRPPAKSDATEWLPRGSHARNSATSPSPLNGTRDQSGSTEPADGKPHHGPGPVMRTVEPAASPTASGQDDGPSGDSQVETTRATTQRRGSALAPPSVMQSCAVALRRMGDTTIRSVAVTSTSRKEGRTTVAMGLAAAAAAEHRRTAILLDLDVKARTTSTAPGESRPGLFEVLDGVASLEDCVETIDEGVQILRVAPPSDPADLLTRMDELGDLLVKLQGATDFVVADLPPLDSGIAGAHLADLFESVILVVRAGGRSISEIDRAALVLRQRPYVMLNGTGTRRRSLIRMVFARG
jgi:Mrp family chromosome partitioning ATPase